MARFQKHIFICGNSRPPGHPRGCCDPDGQKALQKHFKQKLAARGLRSKVRANQSGCLDQCEHGPNVVVYPDAVWYGCVTLQDVDEIIESHVIGNVPVARLRLAESCINTLNCEHRPPLGSTHVSPSADDAERAALLNNKLRKTLS
jgi:(2Fe-2S) ferredoxin